MPVVSVTTAARSWGLDAPDADHGEPPWVTVPRDASRPVPGARTRRADLAPHEVVLLDGTETTSPLRTVIDCARLLPFAWGLAVADSALRLRMITLADLRVAARAARGPGSPALRRVALHADGRSGSCLESLLRALLISARIGPLTLQHAIVDGGHPYDLAIVVLRVLIECDGERFHGHAPRATQDASDTTLATVADWQILRFGWKHVVGEPGWVVEAVRATLVRQRARLSRRFASRLPEHRSALSGRDQVV